MSVRSTEARKAGYIPRGRGAHMIFRAALRDIDEEILHEYRLSMSAVHESSLLAYQHIDGGLRAHCPSLDDLDREGEIPAYVPRRRYAERI